MKKNSRLTCIESDHENYKISVMSFLLFQEHIVKTCTKGFCITDNEIWIEPIFQLATDATVCPL